jgi:hypothetical protein
LTVALLTARAVAPGEDPGLLNDPPASTGLTITLLWLLAALGAALWRLWARGGPWRGGLVEAGLFAAVVLGFVSAAAAVYKHPSRLIAWEWAALFAAFLLVRQLAAGPADRHALFAVFLANAAALSSQAAFQTAKGAAVTSVFSRPDAFAAWLALFAPGLIAAVVVCRIGRAGRWLTAATVVVALLGVVGLAGALWWAFGPAAADEAPLVERWGVTWRLIGSRPWLGVGPGNFAAAFPQFAGPDDLPAADPRNFVLELAATGGVFVPLAVLFALGAFFVRAVRALVARRMAQPGQGAPGTTDRPAIRWEYYLGGMFGLVLGFVVRVGGASHTGEIFGEGMTSAGRCLVWFAALALFERVGWSDRVRTAALTAGVAAMLLTLTVCGGMGTLGVATALWAAVALALNGLPQPQHAWLNRHLVSRLLPVPAVAAAALWFYLAVFGPVADAAARTREASEHAEAYSRVVADRDRRLLPPDKGIKAARELQGVIDKLESARKEDPDDARTYVELARWKGEYWMILNVQEGKQSALQEQIGREAVASAGRTTQLAPPYPDGYTAEYDLRTTFARRTPALPGLGVGLAFRAFERENRLPLPPQPSPGQIEYSERRKEQYRLAGEALLRYVDHDPADARLRWQIADAFYKAENEDRWREQAEEALRLDELATRPARKLTDAQRDKLRARLAPG